MSAWKCAALMCIFAVVNLAAPGQVTFELSQDRLTTPPVAVFVAGPFNGWSTTATAMALEGTTWRARVALPDGRHYYKFVWRDSRGQTHWINDPTNPFLADNSQCGANNFVDVRGGLRVVTTEGLERFEWIAPKAKWVCVAGDFNNWYLGQFPMVRQSDGMWLCYLPVRRPLAYKFIEDGIWKLDLAERAGQVPNGLGGTNSFRPAAEITSPALVTISRAIQPGDARELDIVTSYAMSADYGHAVALARRVAEVNAAAFGTTSPLVLRALDLEGAVHKRWNRWDDAAVCWKQLAAANVPTTATYRGIAELASYYLYVRRDTERARQLFVIAIARAPNKVEMVRTVKPVLMMGVREGRLWETLEAVNRILAQLPPPRSDEKEYACALIELLLVKVHILGRLDQLEEGAAACRKILEISPWPDSSAALQAKSWLKSYEAGRRP